MTPKKDLRHKVYDLGGGLINAGQSMQNFAVTNRKVVAFEPAMYPIPEDDVLVLTNGLALLRNFGWEEVVGMSVICRFDPTTPLNRVGETFSLKGVGVSIDHKHFPVTKKVRKVELNREVIISRTKLMAVAQDFPQVHLIEMDLWVDEQGRLVLTAHPGIGYAYPARPMTTSQTPMW